MGFEKFVYTVKASEKWFRNREEGQWIDKIVGERRNTVMVCLDLQYLNEDLNRECLARSKGVYIGINR